MVQQDSTNTSKSENTETTIVSVQTSPAVQAEEGRRHENKTEKLTDTNNQTDPSNPNTDSLRQSPPIIFVQEELSERKAQKTQLSLDKFFVNSSNLKAGGEWWDTAGGASRYFSDAQSDSNLNASSNTVFDATRHEGVPKPFAMEKEDSIFAALFLCFLTMAFIFRSGISLFKGKSIFHLLRPSPDAGFYSETTAGDAWSNSFLFIVSSFIFSIILYTYFQYCEPGLSANPSLLTIGCIMLIIIVIEIVKNWNYRAWGSLFDLQKVLDSWRNDYKTINYIFGLLSFFPALYLVYADSYHEIAYITVLIIFILTRMVFFYRIIVFFLQQNVNILFLFVYLCSVEILPYVILYFGSEFIYKTDVLSVL